MENVVVASEVNTSRERKVMMASIGSTQLTGLDRTSAQDGLSYTKKQKKNGKSYG